jgi:transcriptional regulator with XRE-family HTH domain
MKPDGPGHGGPAEQPPGGLLGEVLNLADQAVDAMTADDVEDRLRHLIARQPASASRPAVGERGSAGSQEQQRRGEQPAGRPVSSRPGGRQASTAGAGQGVIAQTRAPTTVRLRHLGSNLRRLREAHALELEATARQLGLRASTLKQIEAGRSPAQAGHLTSMLDIYGVRDPGQRQVLLNMARGGYERSWWAVREDHLPAGFELYVNLEAEAASLCNYESQVVFGLLQTEEYARAVLTMVRRQTAAEEIDRLVGLRMHRQRVLYRPDPLRLRVVLDEAVLRRAIGPPELVRRQLFHLCDMARLDAITLQVLDFSSGLHPALNGSYSIIQFPGGSGADVVYSEGIDGHCYIEERPAEVRARSDAFELLASTALSPADSVGLIQAIAGGSA